MNHKRSATHTVNFNRLIIRVNDVHTDGRMDDVGFNSNRKVGTLRLKNLKCPKTTTNNPHKKHA